MYLQIISPESVLFSSHIDSVILPGINGEFQILNNHAPMVSSLGKGIIQIHIHTQEHLSFDALHGRVVPCVQDDRILNVNISSGTIELKDNKTIVLVDL